MENRGHWKKGEYIKVQGGGSDQLMEWRQVIQEESHFKTSSLGLTIEWSWITPICLFQVLVENTFEEMCKPFNKNNEKLYRKL